MPLQDRKNHWENIYQTRSLEEVSWYQPTPETSLALIKEFDLPKAAKIIDIGAGDSFLVDHLLDLGFVNITVLDISASAIERAKQRLGNKSANIKWIVADASDFQPKEQYDFWHDRAAFHFLTADKEIDNYIQTASNAVSKNGIMVIGTFSEEGPKKCSGIDIQQYSESTLVSRFQKHFEKIECFTIDHKTPFDTVQNFVFCSFKRKND
ncbi:MAG: class I SAM-dependent methyltransferase [Flavobacterium lindanitolerans]|jgi:2-polyprenyl-3-methyl-5-hydroxy-6-metoxy-1,4-benzoquinol methylase|uniref:Class I SAM-dependent methyltransferase n=1 Tax=Flavobacterium microcysteis TaxID=2596891 RepID=A0A501Q1U3_9FLAO|nr:MULTISPECIES: class I SAM-dependent methyltransferase [Flavobacterium]MBL7869776.1 class I SAM-dependent methyltransferase [Flavobacterium lindanitolerans]MDL2143493.1 class I SAM-dependent methyltransferase [Flavobacterium tructae]TPD65956.1 class I SAM-dependent methyltransferase [Flavobacterium microcysteis]